MLPVKLKYGNEAFEQIRKFLEENYNKEYTLSIYNNLEQATVEVICDFESMVEVIAYVSNVEHDFPEWIGVNETGQSAISISKNCGSDLPSRFWLYSGSTAPGSNRLHSQNTNRG